MPEEQKNNKEKDTEQQEKKVKYKKEEDVKKALHIDAFEDMPLKKIGAFLKILPQMDKELAAKCMEQFPEFKSYAEATLTYLRGIFEKVIESSSDLDRKAIDSYQSILDDLSWQLKQPNLSLRQQRNIIKQQVDIADKIAKMAERHKKFLWKVLVVAVESALVVGGVVVYVATGGKLPFKR